MYPWQLPAVNEGLSRNFKTHRTKNDYHSWKELVEVSKNMKFGKDRFTNCRHQPVMYGLIVC